MPKLVCESCGAEEDVLVVHCGPGIPGADPNKLYCPMEGHTESIDIPKHCEAPMKYPEQGEENPCCASSSDT